MKLLNTTWKLLLAGSLTSLIGCTADGAESLLILRNQVPEAVAEGGCSVPTTPTPTFRSSGLIDVRSFNGYLFTPLVQNVAEETDNSSRRIFASGANVDISFEGANPPTPSAGLENSVSFRAPLSGSVGAGGLTAFAFEIITRELLADLVDDVTPTNPVLLTANVTIVGELDGDTLESNIFRYPVEVCDGCMRNVLGPCLGLEAENIAVGGACRTNQDGVLDCCTAEDGSLTCPAVPIEIIP